MAFSCWLPGVDTVDTDGGAGAGCTNMFSHVWALGCMLLLLVAVPTNRADDRGGWATAAFLSVAQAEASHAFQEKGARNILMDL